MDSGIVHFFFLLSRKNHCLIPIMNYLYMLLSTLEPQSLELLYNMIFYVRDIHRGLGERELTYMMIYIWSMVYPNQAIDAIYRIVYDGIGSWRDVKGVCRFVRDYSILQDNDPLIYTCVKMMNHQLMLDLSLSTDISLVSKWIPRENSAYHWLYEKCVDHWIRCERPEYIASVRNKRQFEMAIRKGKKEYRGIISQLSRTLNIPQIKQCGRDWSSISYSNVSFHAMMAQRNAFLNITSTGSPRTKSMHDLDRITCAEKFGLAEKFGSLGVKLDTSIQIGKLVRQSLSQNLDFEAEWNALSIPIHGNLLPLFDFTLFPFHERFYDALGIALLIASHSPIHRILGFDQTPIWILKQDTFLSSLRHLRQIYTEKSIGPSSIHSACEFLIQSMINTKMSRSAVENMTLVVFSDFSQSIQDLHLSLTNLFMMAGYIAPVFVYWNMNSDYMFQDSNLFRACMVSGTSISILKHIGSLFPKDWANINPFDFVSQLIQT